MATLIDDGLVEDYLDDPISLVDLQQPKVIDVDSLNATIEDPGYILEENLDTYNRTNKMDIEYTSSYKKQSFTLPVTFFDINSNICLLMKCRPITIKVVDCDIFPWYYKEKKHNIQNESITCTKKEDCEQVFYSVTADPLSLKCKFSKTSPLALNFNVYDNSKLSSEQSLAVSKLREDILKQIFPYETSENRVDDVAKDKGILKNHKGTPSYKFRGLHNSALDYNFDDSIEPNDLLHKYKAIAQNIICNIDQGQVNCKAKDASISFKKTDITGINGLSCIRVGNIDAPNASDNRIEEKKGEQQEKHLTSPILPCTIRARISRSKEMFSNKSKKANKMLDLKCCGSNKQCDQLMSSHKAVPHYHCKLPIPILPSKNFNIMGVNENQVKSQYIPKNKLPFIEQNKIPSNHPPPSKQTNYSAGESDLNPAHYPQKDYTPVTNNVVVTSSVGFTPRSYNDNSLAFSSNMPLNPAFLSTAKKQQLVNNNLNACSTSYSSSRYNRHTVNAYKQQNFLDVGNTNNGHPALAADVASTSKEHYGALSQQPTLRYHAQCPLCVYQNHYPSTMHTFLPRTVNTIQRNPLLTDLNNSTSSESHQSIEKHSGVVGYRPFQSVERNPFPTSGQKYEMALRKPPSYEDYLSSRQFHEANTFQHHNPITHINSNIENKNDSHTNNVNQRSLLVHPSQQFQSLEVKNPENQDYIDGTDRSQNVKKIVSPRTLENFSPSVCEKTIFKAYREVQHLNQIKTRPCWNTINEVLNNIKADADQLSRKKYRKRSKKINNPMINVLPQNKTRNLNSKADKCNRVINENYAVLEDILNPVQQPTKPDQRQYDKLFKMNNIITSKQVTSKGNCYSPPILPIPTFTRSLEMLTEVKHSNSLMVTKKENVKKKIICSSNKNYYTNLIRKRKHQDDMKKDFKSKKISLQEYKQRKLENGKTTTCISIDSASEDNAIAQTQYDRTEHLDIQDLGYDSDATVKLDILN